MEKIFTKGKNRLFIICNLITFINLFAIYSVALSQHMWQCGIDSLLQGHIQVSQNMYFHIIHNISRIFMVFQNGIVFGTVK